MILRLRGPGSKSAKLALKDARDAIKINRLPESMGDVFILVVKSYKHLGTLQAYLLSKGTFQCPTWVDLPVIHF